MHCAFVVYDKEFRGAVNTMTIVQESSDACLDRRRSKKRTVQLVTHDLIVDPHHRAFVVYHREVCGTTQRS